MYELFTKINTQKLEEQKEYGHYPFYSILWDIDRLYDMIQYIHNVDDAYRINVEFTNKSQYVKLRKNGLEIESVEVSNKSADGLIESIQNIVFGYTTHNTEGAEIISQYLKNEVK